MNRTPQQDDELLQQFLVEGRDLVDRASADAAALSAQPDDRSRLDALFRSVHTLKGSAGLFDLPVLVRLLHAQESLLDAARGGGAWVAIAAVTETLDLTEHWLDGLEAGEAASPALIARSRALAADLMGEGEAAMPAAVPVPTRDLGLVSLRYRPTPDAYFLGEDPLAAMRALPGLRRLAVTADTAPAGEVYDPFACTLRFEAWCDAPTSVVEAAVRLLGGAVEITPPAAVEQALIEAGADTAARPIGDLRSLRIDASRLDGLAGLVDELVAAKTALMHLTAATQESRALVNARAALERVVADLHAGVTDLRLVDLGRLLGRFPRLARDIAEGLSKPVEVVLSGEALKLDKSVIEGLHEPLLHLVRNALDHGVEAPAARAAAGKPARARLDITARAEGDQVLVSVADDGQGLDVARIRQKAVERGIVSPDAAAALSDAEAAELIFTPGFSTAGAVSDLSGRGVGMDAVRTAVSRLGGRVSLDNRPGQGLAVSMSLPARVVLTRLLTVTAGGQRFAAPLDAVIELHQVAQSEITDIRDERAYVRRDTVIPLLRLADLLGLTGPADAPRFPALSVDVDGAPVGLQIEAVGERWEAPMRPLSGLLADYPGVLGTVTEGDGAVLLVLNLVELAA